MDLYLATILIGLISLWAMIVGFRQGRKESGWWQLAVQCAAALASTIYFLCIWDQPWVVDYVPHTALIVLANWHPLIGCFFAGMYLASRRIRRRRRLTIGSLTVVLAAYAIVAPVIGRAPECSPDGSASPLITQTTPYTCSAAAAASLLRLHGIETSESEMAELCLTRKGTRWMGVYRGLKLMTQGTAWDVVAQPYTREAVMRLQERPAVLSVNVDMSSVSTTDEHGFRGTSGHSVLALGSRDNREVMVFDPSPAHGIECWDNELLSWFSDGVILLLVPRSEASDEAYVKKRISRATREAHEIAYMSWNASL